MLGDWQVHAVKTVQADVEFAPVSAEVKVHACSCQVLCFHECMRPSPFKQINQAIFCTAWMLRAEVFYSHSSPWQQEITLRGSKLPLKYGDVSNESFSFSRSAAVQFPTEVLNALDISLRAVSWSRICTFCSMLERNEGLSIMPRA